MIQFALAGEKIFPDTPGGNQMFPGSTTPAANIIQYVSASQHSLGYCCGTKC